MSVHINIHVGGLNERIPQCCCTVVAEEKLIIFHLPRLNVYNGGMIDGYTETKAIKTAIKTSTFFEKVNIHTNTDVNVCRKVMQMLCLKRKPLEYYSDSIQRCAQH